ncbi:MAG: hypothetical protein JO227_05980, partial [Acetobacteraceae bacterium]|nr:hypothetical protein [Acetobacteraceae bacterium]
MPVPAIRYAAPLLAEQEQLWHQQAHPRRHDGRILATCQRIAKRAVLLQTLSMASGALAQQSPASLAQLSLQPSSVVWASSSTGTVTLTAPTPNPAIIQLTSDAIGRHISMPASVTVPAGGVSASFPITTDQVFVNQSGMVTATFNGARKTAALSVVVPDVVSINCTPSRLPALATTRCSVTMNGPAPLPTAIFAHSSDVTIVPVPQSIDITVPAKATGISFDVTTGLVPAQTTVTISAHAGTNTVGAFTNLEVDLTTRGRKWVLQNVVLRDGGTVTGYFNYDAATGAYLDANVTATPGANGTG